MTNVNVICPDGKVRPARVSASSRIETPYKGWAVAVVCTRSKDDSTTTVNVSGEVREVDGTFKFFPRGKNRRHVT